MSGRAERARVARQMAFSLISRVVVETGNPAGKARVRTKDSSAVALRFNHHASASRIRLPEPAYVQEFIPQFAIQTFQSPVLRGPPRPDVHKFDPVCHTPRQKMPTGQFRPVIAANALRRASPGDHALQNSGQTAARERYPHLQRRRAFPRIKWRCSTNAAARRDRVGDEIQRPFFVDEGGK